MESLRGQIVGEGGGILGGDEAGDGPGLALVPGVEGGSEPGRHQVPGLGGFFVDGAIHGRGGRVQEELHHGVLVGLHGELLLLASEHVGSQDSRRRSEAGSGWEAISRIMAPLTPLATTS